MPLIPSAVRRRAGTGPPSSAIVLFTDFGLKPHQTLTVHWGLPRA
jgi:hypothetical protein